MPAMTRIEESGGEKGGLTQHGCDSALWAMGAQWFAS
jgi:hypothetical protein